MLSKNTSIPAFILSFIIFSLCIVSFSGSLKAQTTLVAGDIAILGYNTQGTPDNFAILVLKDLSAGTVFYVNDNELATPASTAFTDLNEGEASFTVKAGQSIAAGTVIILPWGTTAVSTTTYDWSTTAGAGLGNNNDEIYVYTASSITSSTPTAFIYYARIGTSTSAIPSSLTLGTTAITPTGAALRYTTTGATYSGCKDVLLTAIGNTATNWNTTGATAILAGDWTFTVNASCATISTTGSITAMSTTYGSPSNESSFNVSGNGMTAGILVTPPTAFEVSLTSGSGFGTSVTVGTSGNIPSTPVYIRLKSTTTVTGSPYSGNIVLSSSGASNVNVSIPASAVAPLAITSTGAIVSNKVYDGNTTAGITGATAVGLVNMDVITISGGGTFSSAAVADNISVTASLVLSGTNATSYTLTQPSGLTANITPKNLTITGLTADNKVFDGNTTATLSGSPMLNGVIAADLANVTLSGTYVANFDTPDIGVGKPVTVTGYTLSGTASGNYSLTQPTGLTAAITSVPSPVITSALTASATYGVVATVYTITATNSPTSFGATGLPGGLTINTTNGEISGTPTVVPGVFNVIISATNAGGTGTATLVYTINPKALTVDAAVGQNKIYNGNAAAVINGSILIGIVGIDDVTINNTGTFNNKNVGTAKPITSTQTLSGADANKYTVSLPLGLTGNITEKELTISGAVAQNKVFDGTTTATITGTLSGVVAPDLVTLTLSGDFATSAVGNGIAVTSTSTIGGADAGNYTLTQPTGLTANITPVPAFLLQWNTFGNAGTETTEPSVFNNTNLTSSSLNYTGSTVTPAGNANRFGGSSWGVGALSTVKYIQFTVTPNAGFTFTATSFDFIWDFSTTGAKSVTLRSSLDNYTADIGSLTNMTASTSAVKSIPLSGFINITTPTTFRLYGYDATGSTGTGGFDCTVSTNNVILNGTTAAAPTAPTVNLSVSSNTASESNNSVITVTATASAAVSGTQTVTLGISGTDITATDYYLTGNTITIPNGQTTGTVTFIVADDGIQENTETAILTISAPTAGITLGATTVQNITIDNNGCGFMCKVGTITSANGAEIPAFDPSSNRIYVVAGTTVEYFTLSNTGTPTLAGSITPGFTPPANTNAIPNSVSIKNGILAVAYDIQDITTLAHQAGRVSFFTAATGAFIHSVTVGFLPDNVTFTPDGTKVLTADEGEPNSYGQGNSFDPEGSVSIIDISNGVLSATVQIAGFTSFNGQLIALRNAGVRIYGPGATVAQDFEPEYIAFSGDGLTAMVTLQENNALAQVNIATATVTSILPLGLKNHNTTGNGMDASDRDLTSTTGKINIQNWPVSGMYQPDAIASYVVGGQTYYITANEGDSRAYTGFSEEVRVGAAAYTLDPTIFPTAATLKLESNLGRLQLTNATGDTDGDGDFDRIDAFGARSFSIWNAAGTLVYDSKDLLEQLSAVKSPTVFNSDGGTTATFDTRSDNKGPEPEGVAIGTIDGIPYAFIGLERVGDVMVFNVADPSAPVFVQYINIAEDNAVEGLIFVNAENSPTNRPLLITAAEVSKTITVYEIGTSIVTNSANAGAGTLRAAIDCAVEGGTIIYDQPTTTTTILTSPLAINKTLTLLGLNSTSKPEITVDFTTLGTNSGISIGNGKNVTVKDVDFKDINNTNLPNNTIIEVLPSSGIKVTGSTVINKL